MTSTTQFEKDLLESLKFSFIHNQFAQNQSHAPKLLINQDETKRYVLLDLQEELTKATSFYFSVAFVTQSGIALIKSQLSDLNDRGVRGKILISPYLDFNDPLAMKELLKLKNVEVRLAPETLQLHSKVYLIDQGMRQVLITGSSNLTGNALKKNYEWNIKLTSTEYGDLILASKTEFFRIWDQSTLLTNEVIERYSQKRKTRIFIEVEESAKSSYVTRLEPNKMQVSALTALEQKRLLGEKKSLVISATGTGKTYLAAFDVRNYKPDRFLFLVHREQILEKAIESFQEVIGFEDGQAVIYKPELDVSKIPYLFATVQTLSRNEHLNRFAADYFDYILIDEVHKAGASSYKKILEHFDPDFFLGMTATLERTDGQNIYELYDYQVAYEIRLQEALDNDLLCPFIYYGVTDIQVDGELLDDTADFNRLISSARLRHLIEKINYYGYSGEQVKGLVFCSRKDEAKELARLFTEHGWPSQSLDGDDSQATRYQAVKDLEEGRLFYLFTVDIFNEGIDIPSVNQVVMLRNTQSSIVFVQQLGRGLRKHSEKEFVTIIDFIGNYKNNYLIPIALFGDQSMNKENYCREVRDAAAIKGLTTVNFEAIAQKQIFEAITNTNLSSMAMLRKSFKDLENRLGRIPRMIDFLKNNQVDPLIFFENNSFRAYYQVISKFSTEALHFSDDKARILEFLTFEILDGKRPHELYLLEVLVERGFISRDEFVQLLSLKGVSTDPAVIGSMERILSLVFLKQSERKRFGAAPLLQASESDYSLSPEVREFLNDWSFKREFIDVLQVGLEKSTSYPDLLTIGQRYTRRDALKFLNFEKDNTPQNIGGYVIDDYSNSCPIFVTYHKDDDISDTIKYEDEFLSESTMRWYSKNNRSFKSRDVSKILNSDENDLRLEMFVKKDDSEKGEFYYLGPVRVIPGSAKEVQRENGKLVSMIFELVNSVEPSLYRYITEK
ncbi:DEAD/DEAH box helicase [Streptococcus sp. 121]|uniref:DUF3427 domain-containing protein n=1 Tax=Streptococcus sp. 121 TaxID=2797637 RepID=UPI0018F0E3CF|nr:DEAD/DEAH box helicase [Streptococcus sp. 121]MBJ6745017.1 DEAD/DEAH box helicase [Streptococcus sp. 121]